MTVKKRGKQAKIVSELKKNLVPNPMVRNYFITTFFVRPNSFCQLIKYYYKILLTVNV